MMIELPEVLGAALKAQANAHGVAFDGYVRDVLERDLAASLAEDRDGKPHEKRTGADLIAALQSSPYREIEIEPARCLCLCYEG